MYGLLDALPLILFLVFFIRDENQSGMQRIFTVRLLQATCGLLLFRFLLRFIIGNANWLPENGLINTLFESIRQFINHKFSINISNTTSDSVFLTSFILLGIILPQLVTSWLHEDDHTTSRKSNSSVFRPVIFIISLLFYLAVIFGGALSIFFLFCLTIGYPSPQALTNLPGWNFVIAALGFLAIFIYGVLNSIYKKLALKPAPSGLIVLSICLLIVFGYIDSMLSRIMGWDANQIFWFLVTGLLGTSLAWALLRLGAWLFDKKKVWFTT